MEKAYMTLTELRDKIKPCPVCGRKPLIHTFGVNYAKVECKPWLSRRAHRRVYTEYCQPSQLLEKAIETWNAAT